MKMISMIGNKKTATQQCRTQKNENEFEETSLHMT